MTDPSKVKPAHTERIALVYVRQSSPSQVQHNRESTARQYALVDRARRFGWATDRVVIIDEDLGSLRRQTLRVHAHDDRGGTRPRWTDPRTRGVTPRAQ